MTDPIERAKNNIEKLDEHTDLTNEGMKPHWKRWLKAPWDVHAYVNLFVESRRLSPYLMGHIDAVLYPILVGLIGYVVYLHVSP